MLAHSSMQNCFNSATFVGFQAWTAHFKSCHNISIGIRFGIRLGHSKTSNLLLFNHFHVDLCVLDHCLAAWPSCASASAHRWMAWHSPVELSDTEQHSWFLLSRQVVQVLRQQSIPKPSHYHHHASKLVWGSYWRTQCLVFARYNGTHLVQKVYSSLPKHTIKSTWKWLKSTKKSSDLIPIEMLCQGLKWAVHAWKPTNVAKLKEFYMEGQQRERLINNYRKHLVGVNAA